MLSVNQHEEIFACILLLLKSQSVFVSSAFLRVIFPLLLLLSTSLNQKPIVSVFRSRLETLFEWQTIFKAQSDSTRYIVTDCKKGQRALTVTSLTPNAIIDTVLSSSSQTNENTCLILLHPFGFSSRCISTQHWSQCYAVNGAGNLWNWTKQKSECNIIIAWIS